MSIVIIGIYATKYLYYITLVVFYTTVGKNNIGALQLRYDFGAITIYQFFQYCDGNIRLFSIAPHTIIALKFARDKVVPFNLFDSISNEFVYSWNFGRAIKNKSKEN